MSRYACVVDSMAQHSLFMFTLLIVFMIVTQQSILSMHCIDQRTWHFVIVRILFIVTCFFFFFFLNFNSLHTKLLTMFQPQENKSCLFSLLKSSKVVVKTNIFIILKLNYFCAKRLLVDYNVFSETMFGHFK